MSRGHYRPERRLIHASMPCSENRTFPPIRTTKGSFPVRVRRYNQSTAHPSFSAACLTFNSRSGRSWFPLPLPPAAKSRPSRRLSNRANSPRRPAIPSMGRASSAAGSARSAKVAGETGLKWYSLKKRAAKGREARRLFAARDHVRVLEYQFRSRTFLLPGGVVVEGIMSRAGLQPLRKPDLAILAFIFSGRVRGIALPAE